ncbi:PD-(D/E)XK nuclease family protein [Saliphagus infecundisoli]|uniref:PD-(D/E)XK nuclease family protein n=1 Tax=Saliphagus infecundisoli TaxID=1849069 RepID=A0ABD5QAP9_9EURY|nr:PD-(D/E)XK nuclease family protein [Saliphagus infecundisoli]
MNVIEYSLGQQRRAEVYVNRLLKYLLDPSEPHGMDDEFLRAFLTSLPSDSGFEEDVHDLSTVDVAEQVQITKGPANDTSTGYLDLAIQSPNEWLVLVELKFGAPDTQTEFYYNEATHIGGDPKTDYDSGIYYVFLHPQDKSTANESEFTNWTWKDFTEDVLQECLADNAPRYPQRTATQLHELQDDIKGITGMTDQQEHDQEKIDLYLTHYDAITDVSETFDERWEEFTDEWAERLGERLQQDGFGSYADFGEHLTAVELTANASSGQSWKFRTSSSDWGMIFKDGWWRHTDELADEIYGRPDDRNDVRIGFHHRLGRNRDRAVRDEKLTFYFRNMGANDQAFIDAFNDKFYSRQSGIEQTLPAASSVTGNKRNMIEATYDIETDAYDGFFEAYVAALEQAFVEHVVKNEQLVELLEGAYFDALDDVYGLSKQGSEVN